MRKTLVVGEAGELGVSPEKVTAFIDKEWKRPLALARKDFYEWQFVKPPHNEGLDRSVVVVDSGGDVYGFMGLNARGFSLDGRERMGAELTTWMITEALQGKGYAPKMLRYLMEQYDVMLGSGITAAALPVYTRLGWRYHRALPRYVRVVNEVSVVDMSDVDSLGKKLIRHYAAMPQEAGFDVEEIDLEEGCSEAVRIGEDFNGFVRSSECLSWRYAKHPVYTYQAFRVQKNRSSAVVVLRVDQSEKMKMVHVLELLGDEAAFSSAVAFVDRFSRDVEADAADFSCMTDRIGYSFWRAGWFSMLDDLSVQVPNLFYPLEVRKPPTSSIIIWAKDMGGSMLDRSRMYVTKGDVDMDRPTQAYLKLHNK